VQRHATNIKATKDKEFHFLVEGEAILARKSLVSEYAEVGGPVFIAVRRIAAQGRLGL